jgi:hypothetical protein
MRQTSLGDRTDVLSSPSERHRIRLHAVGYFKPACERQLCAEVIASQMDVSPPQLMLWSDERKSSTTLVMSWLTVGLDENVINPIWWG